MEKKQCGACQLEVNEIEPLRCGFCDVYFHIGPQCCGFNLSRPSRDLFSQGKALFMCPSCREELNGRSIKSYITDMHESNIPPPDDLQIQVQKLTKLVDTVCQKVDRCLNNTVPADRTVRTKEIWPRLGVKRRCGNDDQPIPAAPDRGTNSIDLSDLSVPCLTPEAPPPKFWLYLSGLHPQVTADDVQKIASRCLKLAAPADVVRLVPRGADVTKLSFVSYKLGLDPSTKDRALDASTWPSGLLFREFIDMSKNRISTTDCDMVTANSN